MIWAGILLLFSLLGFAPSKSPKVAQMEGEEEAWVPNMVDSVVSRAEARKGPRLSDWSQGRPWFQ